jgi:hypothetical protein
MLACLLTSNHADAACCLMLQVAADALCLVLQALALVFIWLACVRAWLIADVRLHCVHARCLHAGGPLLLLST